MKKPPWRAARAKVSAAEARPQDADGEEKKRATAQFS